MRCLLLLVSAALSAQPAVADDKDAKKLFLKMDGTLRAAKTLQCQFDLNLTVSTVKISLKGSMLLGEADTLRLEGESKFLDAGVKVLHVSDGAKLAYRDFGDPKENWTKETPKALGAHARTMFPRYGIGILWNSLNRPVYQASTADLDQVSEFKLGVKEELGKRQTQQIEYTVTRKIDVLSPPKHRIRVWIDLQTSLPVKLVATLDKDAGISAATETYGEFKIDGKIDEKLFKLPK